MDEIWKDVVGYEGWYSVSNLGRVRRDKGGQNRTYKGRLLKPYLNPQGYPVVDLHINGVGKKFPVHKLVTSSFLGERPINKEVNHIDSNRANPCLFNLEYVTRSENTLHAYRNGRGPDNHGVKSGQAKLTDNMVIEARRIYAEGLTSHRELGLKYSVNGSTIGDAINKKTWSHI